MKHFIYHLRILSFWTGLQKPNIGSDSFGVALAVAGPTLRIAGSIVMGSGVFEATFALQTMEMRPGRMISPPPNI